MEASGLGRAVAGLRVGRRKAFKAKWMCLESDSLCMADGQGPTMTRAAMTPVFMG